MQKNRGGRPPRYKKSEEMEALIDAYFAECEGVPYTDDDGIPIYTDKGYIVYKKQPRPPTVTGLALALGFTSRQALLNYQAKKEFVDAITRAKSHVEAYTEERLFDKDGVNGAKFSLTNNFRGWRNKPADETELAALQKLDEILEGINRAAQ